MKMMLTSCTFVQMPQSGFGAGIYEDKDDDVLQKHAAGKAKLSKNMADAANILLSLGDNEGQMLPFNDEE